MDYPPSKTKPWSHQIQAWELASQFSNYYLALDMGGGKSKVAIDYANGFDCRSILIICPKSVISVWPKQFEMHSATRYLIIGNDFRKSWSVAQKVRHAGKRIAMATAMNQPYCLILNFEACFRPPMGPVRDKKNKRRIVDAGLLLNQTWDLVIVDEAHRIKAPGGEASWMCKKLQPKAKRRLALSGTPMPKGPEDIYAQFRFLDPSIFGTNFTVFRSRYCVMGGFENRQIVNYVNMEELTEKFYARAFRVRTADVVDLPDVIHEVRTCELNSAIRRLYNELEGELITQFEGNEITVDNALVKLLRLAQMTSGYIKFDDGSEDHLDSSKYEVLQDLVSDMAIDEPLVIICRFRDEIFNIKKLCEKLGRNVGLLYGGGNDKTAFDEGLCSTLVVQIQAGNAGIDLTRARYCIYFSKGFSLGEYMQSLARVHRPGQTRKVTYYHILAEQTVDMRIASALMRKQRIIEQALLDDVIEQSTAFNDREFVKDILSDMVGENRQAA